AVTGRASGVPEDAAGASRGARREPAGKGGIRSEGPWPGAHRSARETRSAQGYSRGGERQPASRTSARVKPACRHVVVTVGQGRARRHRYCGDKAHDGEFVASVAALPLTVLRVWISRCASLASRSAARGVSATPSTGSGSDACWQDWRHTLAARPAAWAGNA